MLLKELIKERGISLKELSRKTGIAYWSLVKLQNGQIPMYRSYREKLASVLGVSYGDILRTMAIHPNTVKGVRKRLGVSRKELSRRTGISYRILYYIENCEYPLYPKYRKLIAEALGVSEDEL